MSAYLYLLSLWPFSDRLLFATSYFLAYFVGIWCFHFLLVLIESRNWFSKYKILPGKSPSPELVRKAIRKNISGNIVAFVLGYFPAYDASIYFGMEMHTEVINI